MRIAILAHNLRVAGGLSVGQNVLSSLSRVGDQHEYFCTLPENVGYEKIAGPSRCQRYYYRRKGGHVGHLLFDEFELPRRVGEFRPDVVWGLGNVGLKRPPAPQAFLFHKVHFVYEARYRRRESAKNRFVNWMLKSRLRASLPATGLVFCQTSAAAERFRRTFGFDGRIALMPNAVSESALMGDPPARPEIFARLSGKLVLLCLTRYYAHKNLELIAEAFERAKDRLRNVVVLFTVAADQHTHAPAFLERIGQPGVSDHLINVGPLDQRALAAYFTASDGLILPTLMESFTSTYLEAMQFGRPILTSDMDFARVVCGDAAIYFDPFDANALIAAVERFAGDAALRAQLTALGAARRQALVRSWDEIVRDALGEIEQLATRRG